MMMAQGTCRGSQFFIGAGGCENSRPRWGAEDMYRILTGMVNENEVDRGESCVRGCLWVELGGAQVPKCARGNCVGPCDLTVTVGECALLDFVR